MLILHEDIVNIYQTSFPSIVRRLDFITKFIRIKSDGCYVYINRYGNVLSFKPLPNIYNNLDTRDMHLSLTKGFNSDINKKLQCALKSCDVDIKNRAFDEHYWIYYDEPTAHLRDDSYIVFKLNTLYELYQKQRFVVVLTKGDITEGEYRRYLAALAKRPEFDKQECYVNYRMPDKRKFYLPEPELLAYVQDDLNSTLMVLPELSYSMINKNKFQDIPIVYININRERYVNDFYH